MMECFTKEDWAGIVSHIVYEMRDDEHSLQIPTRLRNSYVLVGDPRHRRNNVQQMIKEHLALSETERFLQGPIYSIHTEIALDSS